VEIEVLEAWEPWQSRSKRVGVHRRRVGRKVYESPRVVLPSSFADLVGRVFRVYRGRCRVTLDFGELGKLDHEGEFVLLHFRPSSSVGTKTGP